MNWKITVVILSVAACLGGIAIFVSKSPSRAGVTVTLQIEVSPKEQSNFVLAQANSAKFKYLVGKQSGIKPVLAQKLSVKAVPNSSLVEARVSVTTKDEGRRYIEAFVGELQAECKGQAQVALAQQSVR